MGLKRWNPRSPRRQVAEEEPGGREPDPLGKRPAARPSPLLVGGARNNGPGSSRGGGGGGVLSAVPGGSLSAPPGAGNRRQGREAPGRVWGRSRRALETLRRVGDGAQRSHKTTFQGMLRELATKNEGDVKSLSRVMVRVFSDGVTNWGGIVTPISFAYFFGLCGQTLEDYESRKLHRTTSRKHHRCSPKVKTRLDSQTKRLGWVCGVLPCRGPRRRLQKRAAGFCRCCWSRSRFGTSNKIAF